VDTYLTWGEPPAQVAEKLAWMRGLAAEAGRELRFGIRLHVITRDTEREAWAVAGALLDQLDPEEIATAQQILGHTESAGQDRMHALHARTGAVAWPATWRSTRICGPGSAWYAAARAPRWSAVTSRWPT
jgi:alkanesulfonate monooxygenase